MELFYTCGYSKVNPLKLKAKANLIHYFQWVYSELNLVVCNPPIQTFPLFSRVFQEINHILYISIIIAKVKNRLWSIIFILPMPLLYSVHTISSRELHLSSHHLYLKEHQQKPQWGLELFVGAFISCGGGGGEGKSTFLHSWCWETHLFTDGMSKLHSSGWFAVTHLADICLKQEASFTDGLWKSMLQEKIRTTHLNYM